MNAIRSLLLNIRRILACAGDMALYALTFLRAILCPKVVLAARLLAAESQLSACKHAIASKKQPRPRFTPGFRLLWVILSKCLDRCGIEEVRTAYRSPWQNPFVERFIGTLRRELLDHVIVLSQSHLERLLQAYIKEYYHVARPHQGLDGDTPLPHRTPRKTPGPSKLVSTPVLGGLHHVYVRIAA